MKAAEAASEPINEVVFSSARKFVVVSYYASHGLLLLKSKPVNDGESGFVDLLFQSVCALEIRMWFSGLTVTRRNSDFLDSFSSKPTEMMDPELKVYELKSDGWKGYVLGGMVRSTERGGCKMYDSPLFGNSRPDEMLESGPMREHLWT